MRLLNIILLFVVPFLFSASNCCADHLPPVLPVLPESDHSHENHSGLDYSGQDLHGVIFERANLIGANFQGANLARSNLFLADVDNANFTGAVLTNASLRGLDSSGGTLFLDADLRSVDWDDAFVFNTDFRGANFAGGNLHEFSGGGSDFRTAVFRDPVFGIANTIGSDFFDADLRGVDLSGLDFNRSGLASADLRGANLRGTQLDVFVNIEGIIVDETTIFDSDTTFPENYDPVAAGMTFVPEPSSLAMASLALFSVTIAVSRRKWRPRFSEPRL